MSAETLPTLILISLENDMFGGRDDHYSNGASIGLLRPFAATPEGTLNDPVERTLFGASLSHRIFTPQDLSASERIPDDIAYSGQLVLNLTLATQATDRLSAWSLHLGMVGPLAGAESMQWRVHHWTGSDEPQGWEHQIDNEFLIALSNQAGMRLARVGSEPWAGDALARVASMVGNLATSIEVGLALRTGWNLPRDFRQPPPLYADQLIGLHDVAAGSVRRPACYLLAHAGLAAVAYNVAWDGNLGDDPAEVDYRPLNGRVSAGLVIETQPVVLTLSMHGQSVPWENPADRTFDVFGTIQIEGRF